MLVDLLLTDKRYYTFEGYATRKVSHILEEKGIACRVIDLSAGMLQPYITSLMKRSPTWTLSFSNLTPHCKPLCDMVKIPHFYWVEDSPGPALHYVQSSHGKMGLSDELLCKQLDCTQAVFLPHGVERVPACTVKKMGVVVFADLIELSCLEKTWQKNLGLTQIESIQRAIEEGDPLLASLQFTDAESYLNAQKTREALSTLAGLRIDVFGQHVGCDWLVRLPEGIRLHSLLPYIEYFEVLKHSAMILANASSIWYWPAIAAGCLPLPPDKEQIDYYLAHPQKRAEILEQHARELPHRTWVNQVEKVIQVMSVC